MLYSKRRKNLGGVGKRRKRSNRKSYVSKRSRGMRGGRPAYAKLAKDFTQADLDITTTLLEARPVYNGYEGRQVLNGNYVITDEWYFNNEKSEATVYNIKNRQALLGENFAYLIINAKGIDDPQAEQVLQAALQQNPW